MREIGQFADIYLISSTKGINGNQKTEVPDRARVRDIQRDIDRLKEKAQILQCLFLCFSENSYHVIENVPVNDQRSDVYRFFE